MGFRVADLQWMVMNEHDVSEMLRVMLGDVAHEEDIGRTTINSTKDHTISCLHGQRLYG